MSRFDRRFQAGQMDRVIELQTATTTTGSNGETIATWQLYKRVRASIRWETGGEGFTADARYAKQLVVFQIRYQPGIVPTMRIAYDGRFYEVLDVQELGRRHRLDLRTKVLEAGSGPVVHAPIAPPPATLFFLEQPVDDAGTFGLTWASPLLQRTNAHPKIHVWCHSPNQPGYNAPGSPVLGTTLSDIAARVVEWVLYNKAKYESIGRTFDKYGVFFHGLGDVAADSANEFNGTMSPIFGNLGDELAGMDSGPAPDVSGKSHRYRHRGPFHAVGKALATNQAGDLFEFVHEQLADAGLPQPSWLFFDWEYRYIDMGSATPIGSSTTWWDKAMADPRWATEEVLPGQTMRSLWDARVDGNGAPFAYDPTQSVYAAVNKSFALWLNRTIFRIMDHAVACVLHDTARAVWPGIETGNYNFHATKAGLVNPWLLTKTIWPVAYDATTRFSSQGPMCYGVDPTWMNASSPNRLQDWLATLGLPSTGDHTADLRAVGVEQAARVIDTCTQGQAIPCWPWLRPTQGADLVTTEYGVLDPTLGLDEQMKILEHAVGHGAPLIQLWWGGVLPSQAAADWLDLVDHAATLA